MFLLINKPPNITSHDVIDRLRQITSIQKIGHAGTLDPFATGLLIVAIGRESTKKLNQLLKLDKIYQATLHLGAISNTYDKTGLIQLTTDNKQLTTKKIQETLKNFIGPQLQTPPPFSAKKINGQKAYNLARKGLVPKLKPQKINIYNIKLNKSLITNYYLLITVHCSSGTYIRRLAHDIGKKLGSGASLEKLRRTQIGTFKLKDAISLNKLTKNNWQKFTLANLSLPHKTSALIFGTFDKLHPGHKNFFTQAKKLADELYIVIARDNNVKQVKNKLPQDNELARLKNIKNLNLAAQVILGSQNWQHRYRIINKIKPDIIALGYDQKINMAELKAKLKNKGLKSKIIRLKPYCP